ncbi:MAG TPA: SRPBCC family protein [Thermoleophilaceae bacterium]|nr:SRPBCC family protein [Thermoleophilaceae bacterium]
MRFENHFDVDSPIDSVWDAVLDVERVAPTVPGAQVLERTGDDSYQVAIKVRVGPMSMTYRGQVEIAERDDEAHRAVMKARAKEARGQGTADADVVMQLRGENGRTSATVTTEVELSGKAATMGHGVLQDVAGRLVETFAKNLAAMLEGAEAPPAARTGTSAAGAAAGQAGAAPTAAGTAGTGPSSPGPAAYAAGMPAAETGEPSPPSPGRGFQSEDALDLGSLGGAVIADRLQDPRRLAGLVGLVALVAFLLGRRSAR